MCLAADIPLIESGTAGYLGQVTVIKKVGHWNVSVLIHKVKLIVHKTSLHIRAYCRIFQINITGFNRMLRMPAKATTENIPRLYHKKHTVGAHSLYCVGKTSVQVRINAS